MNWPVGAEARNPAEVLPRCFRDTKWHFYAFRNRWQDENDILATVLTKQSRGYMKAEIDPGLCRACAPAGECARNSSCCLSGFHSRSRVRRVPGWISAWAKVDPALLSVADINKDGIFQLGEMRIGGDIIVLATPEIGGLPYVISGMVAAGGLAAALSTADGLLLTIANALSHDLYYKMIDPNASTQKRITISKVLLLVVAILAATVSAQAPADVLFLVSAAFSRDPRVSLLDCRQLLLFLVVPVVFDLARGTRAHRLLGLVARHETRRRGDESWTPVLGPVSPAASPWSGSRIGSAPSRSIITAMSCGARLHHALSAWRTTPRLTRVE